MVKLKQILLKYFIRVMVLLIVGFTILGIVIIQPTWVSVDIKPAKSQAYRLKNLVTVLSETIPDETAIINVLEAKADFLFQQFSQVTKDVTFQTYSVMDDEYKNIVVNFQGTDQDCGTYVIGAHYDTYAHLPGADDNASGVAGLVELASMFAETPLSCNLQIVAFTLEEPPYFRSEHMGSYIHAHQLSKENIDVQMMISLEMIGYFSDELNSQNYPVKGMQYFYSHAGDFISVVGNLSQISLTRFLKKSMITHTGLKVYSINAPERLTGIDFSDHLNYWKFEYPAVMITDTAFNRNHHYHTTEDTAEKLDYDKMAKVVDGVYYAVLQHMEINK